MELDNLEHDDDIASTLQTQQSFQSKVSFTSYLLSVRISSIIFQQKYLWNLQFYRDCQTQKLLVKLRHWIHSIQCYKTSRIELSTGLLPPPFYMLYSSFNFTFKFLISSFFFYECLRIGYVERANELAAIETLMVTDELFR